MAETEEDNRFAQILQKMDPPRKLLRAWQLKGGVSAQVTALETLLPGGQRQTMLVRQHGARDLQRNPQIAADEFKLLRQLHAAGLAVPEPYYLDLSCLIFSTPYLVIAYREGTTEFAPTDLSDFLLQCATQLARIHQIDSSQMDLSFLPEGERSANAMLRTRPATLDATLDEGRIRDSLEAVWPLPRANTPVLLHGDFWPGNILWKDGRLVAIIDWEDAAVGDPLADLANSRLEILWALGSEAMRDFTHQYQAMSTLDYTHLPVWDLCAALRPIAQIAQWDLDEHTERTMRERHRWFVSQALNQLSLP